MRLQRPHVVQRNRRHPDPFARRTSAKSGAREEADGSFLIATSRGLSRYKPGDIKKADEPPKVVMTSVALGGTERKTTVKSSVAASDASLTVQFSPVMLD